MIKIIYGEKGTGKTKQLINAANDNAQNAKGLSVFITDTHRNKKFNPSAILSPFFLQIVDFPCCHIRICGDF